MKPKCNNSWAFGLLFGLALLVSLICKWTKGSVKTSGYSMYSCVIRAILFLLLCLFTCSWWLRDQLQLNLKFKNNNNLKKQRRGYRTTAVAEWFLISLCLWIRSSRYRIKIANQPCSLCPLDTCCVPGSFIFRSGPARLLMNRALTGLCFFIDHVEDNYIIRGGIK